MLLLKLALRNISRNRRRSLVTILAVGVGLAALIFLWGFNDGTNDQMRENVIKLSTGHIQIHAKGFEKTLTPEKYLPNRAQLLTEIQSHAQVSAMTERVKCEALLGTSEHSRGVLLVGMDPVREQKITDLKKFLRQGSFLETNDNREVLIGNRLAEKLELGIGDKAVIMTQAMDGTLAGYAYHVKGIFHTGSQTLDEVSVYITLSSAQDLLGMNDATHEIVLRLTHQKLIPSLVAELQRSLDPNLYEILKWNEIVPEVDQWAKWSEAIVRTILIAVMVVIGVSIMNTVLMSVFERSREIGVMLAIGTSPAQIIELILLETFILECLGMILGLAAGYLITFYFSHAGIAFPELEQAFSRSYMSTITYTRVENSHVIQSVITLFFLSTFIGLYPAWKAGRMEPVKAIYHS